MADQINLSEAHIHNSWDVKTWPATATITRLEFRPSGVHVESTKTGGEPSDPAKWPEFTPPGWDGPLQFSLWIFLRIAGAWHASGCIQYWRTCEENGGPPEEVAKNWYYAEDRWAPMTGHQPAVGEFVGFMVTAGDARNNGVISVQERSSIIAIPFPKSGDVYPGGAENTTPSPVPVPSAPEPPANPAARDLSDVLAAIAALAVKVDALIAKADPDYVGSVPYLGKLTLKAVK